MATKKLKKFIILSRSRTGSNLLKSYLNAHPNIQAKGEILGRLEGKSYQSILNSAFTTQWPEVKSIGFKIFYYHPVDVKSPELWKSLIKMHDLIILHLKRKNVLKTIISQKVAQQTGIWSSKKKLKTRKETQKIYFPPDELYSKIKQTIYWQSSAEQWFEGHPFLNIYYEDLISNPLNIYKQILNMFGLQYIEPKTDLKKQNIESIKNLLMNYEELKDYFKDTQWKQYFCDNINCKTLNEFE